MSTRRAGMIRSEWEELHGGPEAGRLAWEARPFRTNLGTRPGSFWWYSRGIPPELRGTGEVADLEDYALVAKRCRWLLGGGRKHLRGGERPHLRKRLAQYERLAKQAEKYGTPDPRQWPEAVR